VRSAWGYGYATEAAQAVKSWCHEDRGIERLVSLIAPDNIRSQRVAGKLGARPEKRIQTIVGPTDVWAYHR
jgi:[ribosomal protein S5]-alanine N-acetyltransferase